ncbi:ERCC4 domain-containing protein [Nonomuraea sp. KM90]|uniref:ERCC4 domain-containing protein n=1 Tax=Nonomuraea sp. KM90 TaxID=3457428 RepID=UPI003FCCE13C
MRELVVVRNPDQQSRLPYLIRLPLGEGLFLRAGGTWPREKAIYCYPVGPEEWPEEPEVVERVPVRSCVRRGAAIDLVLDRARENRSQIVFTKARGRDAIFWQTARVRRQARPNVTTPTARASGVAALPIVVDSGERYAYKFPRQQVELVRRRLPCGDYGVEIAGTLHAAVERKSLADLVGSLLNSRLKYQLTELAALPHAAVVVEDRYSQVFKLEYVRPAVVADGMAELQVAFPSVPIVFCESRQLAEEWTYRFLAAAYAAADHPAEAAPAVPATDEPVTMPEPSTAEVRAWARDHGLDVPAKGRLRPEVWQAYRRAHS